MEELYILTQQYFVFLLNVNFNMFLRPHKKTSATSTINYCIFRSFVVLEDLSRATRGSCLAYALRYSDGKPAFFHIVNRFLFFASETTAAVCIPACLIN